ncbi:UvrD-helicase domain-containing protein [Pricia sp. S334]|uniref:DNA 3'-5' helicase n=1 Tax=Pricia mediterranea TaxID=3076079 RepID=A0ABU3L5N9_9FLAO|nr:UvrD-helicase domain-containing protein [Pricia sp. S334]MDT7829049.1 UvrD-helicase domain-containing protein [Pricia sp. S334]
MHPAPFKIFDASAGSGKTHTLTKSYLKIALSTPGRFKKILAITFTNKAVNEMKRRILDSLYQFGTVDDIQLAPPLFRDLMHELQIDAPTLRERSRKTLKEILHNYAFFDVSTIDRFTHRLIRTFAKDLKLPQNFEVILDSDLLLDEAVARLIYRAGTNKELTNVLLDFALEKIDEDKSWDVSIDLFNIGKLLFNETHTPHLEKLKNKEIDDFLELKKILYGKSTTVGGHLIETASTTLRLIEEEGLQNSDFTGSYFPKFLRKIADGDLNMDFSAGWKQNFETATLYNKSAPDDVKSKLDGLHTRLTTIFDSLKTGYFELAFLKNAAGNIVPLTVLNAIQQEVKAVQSENDQLSISEFNALISKEIRNQPAPFIYERLGEKYRHYFIDEFQDTSALQWNNLVPLIGNALESEDMQGRRGSLFLVGDAKQAIYRWRGGRAEQFLNLANAVENPFVETPLTEMLPINYRSHEEVIKFNNDFFTATGPLLNNELYHKLFVEGNRQRYNAKKGGKVQLSFIAQDEDTDKNDRYCGAVLETIQVLTDKKYGYDSICILVRGKKEGVLLADYLAQQDIPTISSESLLLNSSDKVRFLVHLLEFGQDVTNLETAYEILSFLSSEKENPHHFIYNNLHNTATLLRTGYGFDIRILQQISIYDAMELAIKQFDLVPSSDAYITYFMDVVFETEQKQGIGISSFLSHWEKKKGKLGISAPDSIDAVRIMTIHKAKGLEFPIVIFPFANENIYKRTDKKMWLPVDPDRFNGFEEVLVNEKKEVENYGEVAAELYREEEHKMELDAFNVLYVALTRAEKALYVISEKDLTKKGEPKTDLYSGLFIAYLKEKGLWSDDENSYSFGQLNVNTEALPVASHEQVAYRYTFKNRPGFRILTKAGMLWDTGREEALTKGNLIHHALGLVKTERDIETALEGLFRNGDVANHEIENVEKSIRQVVNHPELTEYFQENRIVKNERDIITSNGQILRPDKVVLEGNEATLIDYKTGRPDPKYKEQLYTYADALQAMGYKINNRLIVYINESVTVERV